MVEFKGALFDLDGVIVDTAKYHYLAWKRLAESLGFEFSAERNERLKGVSRRRSLEILLEIGGLSFSEREMLELTERKNAWYVEYLLKLDSGALLPGSREYLEALRSRGARVALASASKNARLILDRCGIAGLFDAIVDGNAVSRAKPDPEAFLKGAEALSLPAAECAVFEDSLAGIEAAKAAGMAAVAVGRPENLPGADLYIANLAEMLI